MRRNSVGLVIALGVAACGPTASMPAGSRGAETGPGDPVSTDGPTATGPGGSADAGSADEPAAPDDTGSGSTGPMLPPSPPRPVCNADGVLVDPWVHIDGTALDERDALEGVAVIDGDLVIHRVPDDNLDFLECITEITGSLYLYDNDALTNIEGLWWLERIGGDVVIADNDALEQLSGLAKITELVEREGEFGTTIPPTLVILGNENLVSIPGLTDLELVFGSVIVRDNPSLVDISGLVGIKAIALELAITNNPQLSATEIDALLRQIEVPATPPSSWAVIANKDDPDVDVQGVPCDPGLQDCPTGTKCLWVASGGGGWDTTRCRPLADDPAAPGESCERTGSGLFGRDSCERGAGCGYVETDGVGVCLQYPAGVVTDSLCPNPLDALVIAPKGPMSCVPPCDPLVQDCPEGLACYPGPNDALVCSPDISSDAGGGAGFPCSFHNVCSPGFWCLDAEAIPGCDSPDGCCSPVCDLDAPVCPAGMTCTPWYDGDASPGSDHIGVCSA